MSLANYEDECNKVGCFVGRKRRRIDIKEKSGDGVRKRRLPNMHVKKKNGDRLR